MSRAFREFYKKKLKASKSISELIGLIIDLKWRQPTAELPEIVSVIRDHFSSGKLSYQWLAKKSPKDLLWIVPSTVVGLESELRFAKFWINSFSDEINSFLTVKLDIQNNILEGNYSTALIDLTGLIDKYGWSVWALELQLAILNLKNDPEKYKIFLSDVSSLSKNRIVGLIVQILKDRNDDDISLDSFISKCNNSFPKLAVDDQIKKYLVYRSYGVIQEDNTNLSSILGIDFLNSIFDYYESLIYGVGLLVMNRHGTHHLPEIAETINALIDSGIADHRLHKLQFMLSGKMTPFESKNDFTYCKIIKDLIVNKETALPTHKQGLIATIEKNIIELNNPDTKDISAASDFFKLGINIRGVDVGNVIVDFSETSFNNPFNESMFPVLLQYIHPDLGVEEFLGGATEVAVLGLSYLAKNDLNIDVRELATNLLSSLDEENHFFSSEGYSFFWLLKTLIDRRQLDKAGQLLDITCSFSPKWKLELSKTKIAYLVELERYEDAIDLALSLILNDDALPNELPTDKLFSRKKWKDFDGINYFKLALIAHFSCANKENNDAKYFCRVACRILVSGSMKNINALLETSNLENKVHLIRFLRDVWVEDNLSHAGFSTTQEIRQERIRVLQILLQFDSDREIEYANEIKTLTFDELMWKGIRQVNETRIFVNESAINRWAEKELNDDFSRWKKIAQTDHEPENIVDDLLRQYLSGVETGDLKYSFGDSKSTEADIIIYGIANRLLERFLFDTADGLDSYLSSRIRHGTLKGTILGPLEEAGLIGASESLLTNGSTLVPLSMSGEIAQNAVLLLKQFESSVDSTIKMLITDIVRINSLTTPKGKIVAHLHPIKSGIYLSSLMRDCTFHQFTQACFDIFWKILQPSLEDLAFYFKHNVKDIFQNEFDKLIDGFRIKDGELDSTIDKITKISTQTQAQIDLVSNWFQSDRKIEQQVFHLSEAIDVAVSVTKNVYRFFSSCVVERNIKNDIPLTSLGLLGITDCLYILLENAWKHSGLGASLSNIHIDSFLEAESNVLIFSVSNPLSQDRVEQVDQKFVDEICSKFGSEEFSNLASKEDGSGFAKLTKLAKNLNSGCDVKLPRVVVNEEHWIVTISIPIYQRGEAYDAYFE
jgi:hypothetical protein